MNNLEYVKNNYDYKKYTCPSDYDNRLIEKFCELVDFDLGEEVDMRECYDCWRIKVDKNILK